MKRPSFSLLALSLLLACESKPPSSAKLAPEQPQQPAQAASVQPAASKPLPTAVQPIGLEPLAKVGQPAPEFTLQDLDGKQVTLSSFKGKTVVLEWFNPECPFVKLSHSKGSLVDTAAKHAKQGVIWLAINSGAPGKQGHELEKNREAKKTFNLAHPILRDEDGKVGKAYGAERTPHLFVINPEGVLVYRGAIDNSPDGEKNAPTGGVLVNYVDAALADLVAARELATTDTAAYGCRVKYADGPLPGSGSAAPPSAAGEASSPAAAGAPAAR